VLGPTIRSTPATISTELPEVAPLKLRPEIEAQAFQSGETNPLSLPDVETKTLLDETCAPPLPNRASPLLVTPENAAPVCALAPSVPALPPVVPEEVEHHYLTAGSGDAEGFADRHRGVRGVV